MRNSLHGYSLPLVLGILAIIALGLSVLLSVIIGSNNITGDMVNRRKAFYACDGIQRSIIQLGNDYLGSDDSPTPGEMQTFVEAAAGGAALPNITPAGFTVDLFTVAFNPTDIVTLPLPNGPFKGMNSRQTPVDFNVEAQLNGSSIRCGQSLEVVLAQVGMFQFLSFADVPVNMGAAPGGTFDGRFHTNGDFCVQGYGSTSPRLTTVTASGRIINANDGGRCEAEIGFGQTSGSGIFTGSTYVALNTNNDSGCANCAGSGQAWKEYALSTWNGNVLDVEHDVPALRLPVAGATPTQVGWNARIQDATAIANQTFDNNGTARFLINPPQLGDSPGVKSQRYACKADIRIVDGVWYLRDAAPLDDCGWPGTPIWSDHTGNFSGTGHSGIHNHGPVGQLDLNGLRTWGGAFPSRYSYYERKTVGDASIAVNAEGVVSYGTLYPVGTGTNTVWRPGHFADGVTAYDNCKAGAANGRNGNFYDATQVTAIAGCAELNLLNATRSGFLNGHAEVTRDHTRAKVLPMNFDVAEFQNALADTGVGELGSYFNGVGRTFNGIVYITNTWTGSDDNYGSSSTHPTLYPEQGRDTGSSAGLSHPGHGHNSSYKQQLRLPAQLCNNPGVALGTSAGTSLGDACTDAGLGIPNAVRIFNARKINFQGVAATGGPFANPPTALGELPDGISIVTNLPYYLMGDINRSSNVRDAAASKTNAANPWVPFMVGGDLGHLLSNAWNDGVADWAHDGSSTHGDRDPSDSRHNVAMLTGANVSKGGRYDGGIHNIPRFLEDWADGSAPDHIFTGSIVVSHAPVHSDHAWVYTNASYTFPTRDWAFDPHFALIDSQPPGAPVFDVSALKRWTRF